MGAYQLAQAFTSRPPAQTAEEKKAAWDGMFAHLRNEVYRAIDHGLQPNYVEFLGKFPVSPDDSLHAASGDLHLFICIPGGPPHG